MLEKVGIREKIPTGGLSLFPHPPQFPSFARRPFHFPPHAMSANIIQPFFLLQPANLSFPSFPRILFSFFPEGGAIWVPHASHLWAGSVRNDLLVVYLRGFLPDPFSRALLLIIHHFITWIVLSVPLSKLAILVN